MRQIGYDLHVSTCPRCETVRVSGLTPRALGCSGTYEAPHNRVENLVAAFPLFVGDDSVEREASTR